MKRLVTTGTPIVAMMLGVAPVGVSYGGSVLDDAAFKLDLRGDLNGNAFIDSGEVGNAYDFSSVSPMVGVYGSAGFTINATPGYDQSQWGVLPQQEETPVQNPYYPYTTSTRTCLHFYQSSKTENGTTYWAQQGITFVGGAISGNDEAKTIYVRCRWDGNTSGPNMLVLNGFNAWATSGQSLCLTGGGEIAMLIDGNQVNSGLYVSSGQWCDIFAETENMTVSGTTKAVTKITLCKPSANGSNFNPPTLSTATLNHTVAMNIPVGRSLSIGCFYHNNYWNGNAVYTAGANPRSFRGVVADVMIWNRALATVEKIEVMAENHGAKWIVGAVNDSADEFADSEPAAVFNPQTMSWRQMRKSLTAENPTLTLKSSFGGYETNMPMIVTLTPILTDTAVAVPVTLAVNGDTVGMFDLAKAEQRSMMIPAKFWKRDASGNVTVTITRTEATGTVAIDAIALSGSWQNTSDDGGSNGMLDQQYAPSHAFAGDTNIKHFPASLSVGNNRTNWTFGVWVPSGMGAKCGWTFRTRISNGANTSGLGESHAVLVNGVTVETHTGTFAIGEYFMVSIPEGVLHDGMNYVQFVQTAPSRSAPNYSGSVWQAYDFWGMTIVPPKRGMIISIR